MKGKSVIMQKMKADKDTETSISKEYVRGYWKILFKGNALGKGLKISAYVDFISCALHSQPLSLRGWNMLEMPGIFQIKPSTPLS